MAFYDAVERRAQKLGNGQHKFPMISRRHFDEYLYLCEPRHGSSRGAVIPIENACVPQYRPNQANIGDRS